MSFVRHPRTPPAPPRLPANQEPDQFPIVPPPKTIGDAVQQMHDASWNIAQVMARLEHMLKLETTPPEMHTVIINPGNNGQYVTTDPANGWAAKSIGIINPGATDVFVGIGGHSATPTSRSPQVPKAGALVLPVEAFDIEFGCDPAILLTNTAVIYVFRYVTVQPLLIMGNL